MSRLVLSPTMQAQLNAAWRQCVRGTLAQAAFVDDMDADEWEAFKRNAEHGARMKRPRRVDVTDEQLLEQVVDMERDYPGLNRKAYYERVARVTGLKPSWIQERVNRARKAAEK